MTVKPYDYERRQGLLPISWEAFHGLCKALAVAMTEYEPEVLLPVGRGGYYAGTLLSHILQIEIFPIRLSRRVKDIVTYETPQWLVGPPAIIRDKRVVIVDEISSTGQTLRLASGKAMEVGAKSVRTAVLYAHSWGVDIPDYIGIISDGLILNPWDREIWKDGRFQFHPEYAEALNQQGIEPEPSMLVDAPEVKLAKGGM